MFVAAYGVLPPGADSPEIIMGLFANIPLAIAVRASSVSLGIGSAFGDPAASGAITKALSGSPTAGMRAELDAVRDRFFASAEKGGSL